MLGHTMGPRFQLAAAVTFTLRPDGKVEVSNGADLAFPVSAAQARVLEGFREPRAVEELAEEGPTREALRRLTVDLEKKLVMVRADLSPDREMQLVWNYLSMGSAERALFHIDNESHTLEDFETSGVEAARAISSLVPLHAGLRLATIGCGMGRIEKALAPLVRHITAFDISDQMLAHARGWLGDVSNVALELTDGTLSALGAATVDLVASFLVFQHVTREGTWRYFEEAARVLVPRGHFLFQIHCYPEDATAPQVVSAVDRYYGAGKATYREAELRAQLARVGFQVDALRDGAATGDERRLTGTPGPWRSVLVLATRAGA